MDQIDGFRLFMQVVLVAMLALLVGIPAAAIVIIIRI